MLSDEYISTKSLFAEINRFLDSVKKMNDTVMIPSRLMDISADTDLYSLQSMLNNAKSELLMPTSSKYDSETNNSSTPSTPVSRSSSKKSSAGDSDDGFISLNSYDSSDDARSESSSEEPSSPTEDDTANNSKELNEMALFRYHLEGLQKTMKTLAQHANNVTVSYVEVAEN